MKLFDHDSFTGVTEHFKKDQMTGQITIKKTQDVEQVFDRNTQLKNNNQGWKGEMHHVASIPMIVIDMWREELKAQGVSNPDPLAKENKSFLIAKINNSDFSKLRTKEGRI